MRCLLFMLAVLLPSAAFAQTWPNEPAGFTTLLDCNFTSPTCGGALYDVYGTAHSVSTTGNPLSAPTSFEDVLLAGAQFGGGQIGFSAAPVPEVYVGFWWKLNSTFVGGWPDNANQKLVFMKNTQPGYEKALISFHNQSDNTYLVAWSTDDVALNDANAHLSNSSGEIHYGLGTCLIARDQWVRIEYYLKSSSSTSSRDGIVRWWANGTLCGNYTNANWPGLTENQWEANHTWTFTDSPGCTHPCFDPRPVDSRIWFDHLHVSALTSAGDTTPPTQVTGLLATPGNTTVQLSNMACTDNVGIGAINIERALASNGPFTPIAQVGGGGAPVITNGAYLDTGLTNGTTYYYRARCQDSANPGNVGPSSVTVSATPQAPTGGSATTIGITQGKFTINGTSTFLQCFSYYDLSNYHTADIDALAADGYNCLIGHVDDVLRNDANSAYNNNGSTKSAKETALEAAIHYADTKGMVVLLNCLYADIDGSNSAAYIASSSLTTAITNCVNAFKDNGNVFFSLVNEHNFGSFADTHAEMQAFMTAARTACPACLLSFSSTDNFGVFPAGGHLFTTQDGTVVHTANVDAELATGINFLLWHDERNSGYDSRAAARVANMRAYLASINRQDVPLLGDEPGREGNGGLGSAAAYFAYYQTMKNAGIAGIDHHTAAAFDLDPTQAIPNQTDAVEEAVMDGLAAALAVGTGQVRDTPIFTDPFTRANSTELGASWDPETIGSHTNLQIVSNRIRPTSTTLESRETYNGAMPNNQWACLELPTFTAGTSYTWAMVMLRWSGPGVGNGYDFRAYRNNHLGVTTEIVRKDADNPAALVSNTTTWAAGDELCGEANGSTLTLYKNDVAVATATDTTYSSGRVGAYLWSDAAVTDVEGDNFSAGGFTTVPTIITPAITGLTLSSTGLTYTYSGSLASVRLATAAGSTIYALASTPGGVLTHPWTVIDGDFACLFARDANGVENILPTDYRCDDPRPFVPVTDTTPPISTNIVPIGVVLAAGTTQVTLSENTNEVAQCRWHTSDVAYASMANAFTTTGGMSHSTVVTGLTNSTAYTRYSRCIDAAGNAQLTSNVHTYQVETPPATDTTPPSTVTDLSAQLITNTQILWAWAAATDASGINHYNLWRCTDGVPCTTRTLISAPSNISYPENGLSPGTTYVRAVTAVDNFGNESATLSNIVSATTLPLSSGDVTPPSDLANLRLLIPATSTQIALTWDVGSDLGGSGLSIPLIERCRGVGCTDFTTIGGASAGQLIDQVVLPGSTYRYRGKNTDGAGNVSPNYSAVLPVTTPDVPVGTKEGLCNCRRNRR